MSNKKNKSLDLHYLRAIRIMAGFGTMPKLSRKTGISVVTLMKVENGQVVSEKTLDKYGAAIGLNVEAVKLLRTGRLRPYLQLKKANGDKFSFGRKKETTKKEK